MSKLSDTINSKLAEYGITPHPSEEETQPKSETNALPYIELQPVISSMAREIGGVLCQNGVFVRQRAAMTVSPDGRLVEMTARPPARSPSICTVPLRSRPRTLGSAVPGSLDVLIGSLDY